jgi:hypothetical protein
MDARHECSSPTSSWPDSPSKRRICDAPLPRRASKGSGDSRRGHLARYRACAPQRCPASCWLARSARVYHREDEGCPSRRSQMPPGVVGRRSEPTCSAWQQARIMVDASRSPGLECRGPAPVRCEDLTRLEAGTSFLAKRSYRCIRMSSPGSTPPPGNSHQVRRSELSVLSCETEACAPMHRAAPPKTAAR